MTIQSGTINSSVSKVQTAVVAKTTTRLDYLDSLRAILIILVIALHTAITYGASGDWTYEDPGQSEIAGILLTLVTASVQSFSMGLYFFISGYFTPGSYDRKGLLRFWGERLLRLGIPLIVYTFALSRIPVYFAGRAYGHVTSSFWEFFGSTFISGADEGPTWFIFALLLFLIGYTVWRLATRSNAHKKPAEANLLKVPGKRGILTLGVVVGVLMFVVGLKSGIGEIIEVFGIFNLMTIFFVQYILFFILGTLAYRNDWVRRFNGKDLRVWTWLSVGLFLLMPVLFFLGGAASGSTDVFVGGLYWQSAAFMLWVGLFSVSMSMTLILGLRDRQKPRSSLMKFAGPNSYGVYLIHPLILVPLSVAARNIALPPLLKFAIVLPIVVILCFLVADALRRIPGVKSIL
jgi:peptidoglycan/LPS O-acetylase OafA/YrhL